MNSPRSRNQLLASLEVDDFMHLSKRLKSVNFKIRQVFEKAHSKIETVCFPESGLLSVVAKANKKQIEVGILGREGCTGLALILGGHLSPFETFVQVEGSGLTIEADIFQAVLEERPEMKNKFLSYSRAFMVQIAYTALANGSANITERLARWLLMTEDRINSPHIPLTHEFLAIMLGVRRPGVTVALNYLEGLGYIKAKRGNIEILDRAGLVAIARESYNLTEMEYDKVVGYRPGKNSSK